MPLKSSARLDPCEDRTELDRRVAKGKDGVDVPAVVSVDPDADELDVLLDTASEYPELSRFPWGLSANSASPRICARRRRPGCPRSLTGLPFRHRVGPPPGTPRADLLPCA